MSWNYRIVKTVLDDEESSFDVCEVHYDKEGVPSSFSTNKNILSTNDFEGLEWAYKEVGKAYQKPILENVDGELRLLPTCPRCGKDVIRYEIPSSRSDGTATNSLKEIVGCTDPIKCSVWYD